MTSFRSAYNTATKKDIYEHLICCSDQFAPPLSGTVDINEYAKKMYSLADTIEFWVDDNLVGLVAIYLNDTANKKAFITNVSVEKFVQGRGLAKSLMNQTCRRAITLGFKSILLEVGKDNLKAISLYKKLGFFPVFEKNGFVGMKKEL